MRQRRRRRIVPAKRCRIAGCRVRCRTLVQLLANVSVRVCPEHIFQLRDGTLSFEALKPHRSPTAHLYRDLGGEAGGP
jgi:hypothetical protein